jgi:hypothetical protein
MCSFFFLEINSRKLPWTSGVVISKFTLCPESGVADSVDYHFAVVHIFALLFTTDDNTRPDGGESTFTTVITTTCGALQTLNNSDLCRKFS